jgi:glucose/arabinose dehydrogenase
MKLVITFLFTLTLSLSYSQLTGGDVLAEGRDVVPGSKFIAEGAHNGWVVMTLAVDREGNVTSAQLKETNLKSSIDRMQMKKHAMALKFVSGTHFPKFHNAEVRITMLKSENPPQELEIIID